MKHQNDLERQELVGVFREIARRLEAGECIGVACTFVAPVLGDESKLMTSTIISAQGLSDAGVQQLGGLVLLLSRRMANMLDDTNDVARCPRHTIPLELRGESLVCPSCVPEEEDDHRHCGRRFCGPPEAPLVECTCACAGCRRSRRDQESADA